MDSEVRRSQGPITCKPTLRYPEGLIPTRRTRFASFAYLMQKCHINNLVTMHSALAPRSDRLAHCIVCNKDKYGCKPLAESCRDHLSAVCIMLAA